MKILKLIIRMQVNLLHSNNQRSYYEEHRASEHHMADKLI